jgi:hypothetical protein
VFVLITDQKQKDNQDKDTLTGKVQTQYKRIQKKSRWGH